MKRQMTISSDEVSRPFQAFYLITLIGMTMIFPLTGLRRLVMQHHMICEELCRDNPDLICPVDLDLSSIFAMEVFWLPASLSICVVTATAILIKNRETTTYFAPFPEKKASASWFDQPGPVVQEIYEPKPQNQKLQVMRYRTLDPASLN